MSEENVEIFKRGVEAWNRKDIPGFLRAADPEIRWEHRLADLEGDLTGVDAVRAWHEDLARHFDHRSKLRRGLGASGMSPDRWSGLAAGYDSPEEEVQEEEPPLGGSGQEEEVQEEKEEVT